MVETRATGKLCASAAFCLYHSHNCEGEGSMTASDEVCVAYEAMFRKVVVVGSLPRCLCNCVWCRASWPNKPLLSGRRG